MNTLRKFVVVAATAPLIWGAESSWFESTNSAQAGVVAKHVGATDPTAEGWAVRDLTHGGAPPISRYPVMDDLGTGIDAWAIDDDSLIAEGGYRFDLSPQVLADAQSVGWRLSTRLRVVDMPLEEPTMQFTIAQVLVSDDQYRTFGISVSMERDGSPLVNVGPEARPEIVDLDDLDSGYHLYELQFDPTTHRAALFVDEMLRATDIRSFINPHFASGVDFGSTFQGGSGHANYALVTYAVGIPEPATMPLVAVAALATSLGWARRHRRLIPTKWASRVFAVVMSAILTLGTNAASAQPILEWVDQYGTSGLDTACDVAVGPAGNVYVADRTEYFDGIAPGAAFVRKYDSSGALLWMQELRAEIDESVAFHGVSVDGSGNVYVAGYTDSNVAGMNAGSWDVLLRKYDASGAEQWTRQWGTNQTDWATSVAVDDLGYVYVGGNTLGSLQGTNHGDTDAFLTKYDASGALQWTRQWGGSLMDESNDVAADGLGNIYIAGFVDDIRNGFIRDGDAFLAKYDTNGAQQWMRTFSEGQGSAASGVSVDGLGNVYLAGTTDWALDLEDSEPIVVIEDTDLFIAKYDTDGALQWLQSERSSERENGTGVSADELGNVYVAGVTSVVDSYPDAFLRKYDSSGTYQWNQLLGTSSSDRAEGVATTGLGEIYIAGVTRGSLGAPNAGGLADWFLAKFVDPQAIPEPSAGFLIALGAVWLALWHTKRQHNAMLGGLR